MTPSTPQAGEWSKCPYCGVSSNGGLMHVSGCVPPTTEPKPESNLTEREESCENPAKIRENLPDGKPESKESAGYSNPQYSREQPRECNHSFRIDGKTGYINYNPLEPSPFETVRMIEKSAYDKLLADYEAQYTEYTNLLNSATVKANEKLLAERDELRAELESAYTHWDGETEVRRAERDELIKAIRTCDVQSMNSIVQKVQHEEVEKLRAELAENGRLWIEETERLRRERDEARAEVERLKKTISYLPKVPTQPYEKRLAQTCNRYREALERITEVAYGYGGESPHQQIAREALRKDEG